MRDILDTERLDSRLNMKIKIAAGVLAASIVTFFLWLQSSSTIAPQSQFVMLDGTTKTTMDFRGQVMLVNFWATSCTSCIAEMPALTRTFEKQRGKGFHLIAVAMHYDPPSYVVNYAKSRQLPFDVAIDNTGNIAQAWGKVQLTPTTFIVNKQGEIIKRYVGTPDFAEVDKLIEKLLKT